MLVGKYYQRSTGDSNNDNKLSLDSLLVNQVINSVSSMIDPTLPSESEVVESMSFLPNPILLLENVLIEAVTVI